MEGHQHILEEQEKRDEMQKMLRRKPEIGKEERFHIQIKQGRPKPGKG
jgi:hypothetical protein